MSRKYVLHSGQRGSALAVRITPRASRNQIVGVLSDGTVKVHLASEPVIPHGAPPKAHNING